MDKKYLFIDFEFNKSSERYVDIVSCSFITTTDMHAFTTPETVWLYGDSTEQYRLFFDLWEEYALQGYIFVCFQAEAEVRSILSLVNSSYGHLTKLWDWPWIDLWVEYRHLQNQNHKIAYGHQLIGGRELVTKPPKPKWQRREGETGSQKPEGNLAAACYKLLKKRVDTERKDRVRDLIISAPESFTLEEQEEILEYNESDIELLPELFKAIVAEYKRLLPPNVWKGLKAEMISRAEFSVHTAYMTQEGYPVIVDELRGFSESVPLIMNDLCRDINSQFDFSPYAWKKKEMAFSWREKATKEYLREIYPELMDKWMKTDSGDISLKLDALTQHFDFKHSYPRGHFGAQMVRFLKVRQSLAGFSSKANSTKGSIWDALGSDGRVRPYMNIYRSQSYRSQPSSKTFLFLKAAWMRAMDVPPEGYVRFGIDWASQEFLIGALWAEDYNMIEAYQSGDPYLWFGKAAKKIPKSADKNHPLRDGFKSTTLAEMYLMGIESLANKITNDTGNPCSIEQAEELDSYFREIFSVFCDARMQAVDDYYREKKLRLPDGCYMWGDNDNFRSIANCPIQGAGSAIMRKAVSLAHRKGVTLTFTLHDALYGICRLEELEEKIELLAEAMDEAFRFFWPKRLKRLANCRLESNAWSPELTDDFWHTKNLNIPVKQQPIYVDKRSLEDYRKFEVYLKSGSVRNIDL